MDGIRLKNIPMEEIREDENTDNQSEKNQNLAENEKENKSEENEKKWRKSSEIVEELRGSNGDIENVENSENRENGHGDSNPFGNSDASVSDPDENGNPFGDPRHTVTYITFLGSYFMTISNILYRSLFL